MKTLTRSLLVAAFLVCAAPLLHAQEADLAVQKFGPSESAADTDVTYEITFTNIGPDDANQASVSDDIPAGMTFVSANQDTGPTFTCSTPSVGDTSGSIECSIATFAAGATATFSFVFHIPSGTPAGTSFVNIATAGSETFDPNDENDSGVAGTTVPAPPQADLGVMKSGPSGAGADSDVVYTITLTNSGPGDAENVSLNDTLPNTMTFVSLTHDSTLSCSTPAVGAGGTITCTGASLALGTYTFTLTGHIPAGTPSGTAFTNTVNVSSTNDPNEENSNAQTELIVSDANLSITKTGPATAFAGDEITYTITVTNSGPDSAIEVMMEDVLPPNTTFVSLTAPGGWACATPSVGTNGALSCTNLFLGTTSAVFTLVIEVGNTTEVSNTATVTASGADSDTSNNSSTATTTITPSADLSVTKTGPATADSGTDITYTITVSNLGASDADNVSMIDTPPAGTTFVSLAQTSGPTFTCTTPAVGSPGAIDCDLALFGADQTATFNLVVHVTPAAADGSSFVNDAQVLSGTTDPDSGNNNATFTTIVSSSADLGITKTSSGPTEPGQNLTYTITITNNGPSDAADLVLTDTVPANTTFVSLTQPTGPTFSCTTPPVGGTGAINCTLAGLLTGASATFELVVQVSPAATDGTEIENTANITASTSDPDPDNNTATASTAVNSNADLTITKTGPNTTSPDATIAYDITITNNGPTDAINVEMTDVLPANTTFASLTSPAGWSCTTPAVGATGTVTCTIATLPNGAVAEFVLVVNVTSTASGDITNTASVTSPSDPTPTNNAGTTTANVGIAGVPTLSPFALALLALSMAAVVMLVLRR